MTVLVTGATGTNGLEVVKQTLARGGRVRAFVRDKTAAAAVLPPEVELFEGDFAQRTAARAALRGVDRVFLLAAVHEHMEDFERGFIEEARDAKVAHLVKFSAIGAHPGSKTFFGRVHGRAECALVESGLPYTILQPSFFMQNSLWSAETIKRDGAIYNATGTGAAGHVDAQDTASVAAAALTEPVQRHAGEIYLVTGPERLTFDDIAERFSRVLGRSVRHVAVPDEAYKDTMMRQGGMPEWQAQGVLDLEVRCRVGDFSAVTDTVERVGKRRPTTFAEFIRRHAAAFTG
jgi:uncharacterized protein YbjT (DUF2867 family)